MVALLIAMEAIDPTSVLAIRVRDPFRSHDSMPPSRFMLTLYFSSRFKVRGVDGAAEGAALVAANPSPAPAFLLCPPSKEKLSSIAIAAIRLFFFLFAPPIPPSFIPFATTRGPWSSGSALGFSNPKDALAEPPILDPEYPDVDVLCSYPGVTPPPPNPTMPEVGIAEDDPLPMMLSLRASICRFLIWADFSSMAFRASSFFFDSIMICTFSS
mmetsp:Transcript_20879/g.31713  ORF Transcript_20879/g.31713 Transcript_20879/m.31713 type:complete len:213 (+) Transcript_20879:715-1353(+)